MDHLKTGTKFKQTDIFRIGKYTLSYSKKKIANKNYYVNSPQSKIIQV